MLLFMQGTTVYLSLHKGCGHVVVSARSGVNVGDRVTFSVTDTCGNCDKCQYGPQQKCVSLKKYGHIQHGEGTVPRQR